MAIAYLAHAPVGTFQIGLVFCAYIPTTHHGIVDRINATAVQTNGFGGIPMFIYMSERDWIISNCQTNEFATKFVNPTRATAGFGGPFTTGGHFLPGRGESGFDRIVPFMNANHTDGSWVVPTPSSDETRLSGCPSFIIILIRLYWLHCTLALLFCCCCCCGCFRYVCGGRFTYCGEAEQVSVDAETDEGIKLVPVALAPDGSHPVVEFEEATPSIDIEEATSSSLEATDSSSTI